MKYEETMGSWEDYHTEVSADTESLMTILTDIENQEEPDETGRTHALYDIVMHLSYLNDLYMELVNRDIRNK